MGASAVTTGGTKSGWETLCLSSEVLGWHAASVHLCQFENARTEGRARGSDGVTGWEGVKSAKV